MASSVEAAAVEEEEDEVAVRRQQMARNSGEMKLRGEHRVARRRGRSSRQWRALRTSLSGTALAGGGRILNLHPRSQTAGTLSDLCTRVPSLNRS